MGRARILLLQRLRGGVHRKTVSKAELKVICPHCHASFEVQLGVELGGRKGVAKEGEKGGLSSPDLSESERPETGSDQILPPYLPKRGKNRTYTQLFETAWKLYGRKEEKGQAFKAWLVASGEVSGEDRLLSLVMGSLRWQGEIWGADGWRFAPYFERYLRKRRWEDEPLPQPVGMALVRAPIDRRPQWQRDQEVGGQREKAESARYHARQAQEKSRCGFHLYRGEDKRYVLEECTQRCPEFGRDLDGNQVAVR